MTTEFDMLKAFSEGTIAFPPLKISSFQREPKLKALAAGPYRPDALLEMARGRRRWKFLAEFKSASTSQAIENALAAIQPAAAKARMNSMIVLPYLSPENLARLEEINISGLDLCGNGIVTVPDELFVVRTGQPNQFPRSEPIRNVYRGDSSMVPRAFLFKPAYKAVGQILTTIKNAGGDLSLATVSKVLKTLQADLIVGRSPGEIKLLQADKLLDQLVANYREPKVVERYVGKISLDERMLPKALIAAARRIGAKLLLTGAASASRYSVLSREPIVAAYCNVPPRQILSALGAVPEPTDRFPNIDLKYTDDRPPYFESAMQDSVNYASPVQTYLELMAGDKRQRETADQVREYLLRRVRGYGTKS